MNLKMTRLFLLLLLSGGLSTAIWAQHNELSISGKVVQQGTDAAVEFATVMLLDPTTEQAVDGTSTELDGTFKLLAPAGRYDLQISFIGFQDERVKNIIVEDATIDLGIINLRENSALLDEVVVRAEKSTTEFRLDKRVFNVGKDLSSTGASALDVLNNVPSVNVSIEGEISLRGSAGVQILINGKPSVLADEQGGALGTITAEMIESIEVITNPSAKYEAEGTAGIINIVLRKDERKGMNGSVSVNTGVPDNHSVGLSLNRRTEKFNLFSQFGVGYRELPNDTEVLNRDRSTGQTISSIGEQFRNETFYNVILGTDYYINKQNVITLSGNFAYEIEDQPSRTFFTQTDANSAILSEWTREETTEATNPKYQYELQYKRDFPDNEDHTLLFSALGRFFGKDQNSDFSNTTTFGADFDALQQTRTKFQEATYTFKLDYTHPLSEEITLETGAQFVLNDVSNDFEVKDWVEDMFVTNPGLTNVFNYDQEVLGVYGTGAYEGDRWGIKLGLRAEHTLLNTLLVTTNETNKQEFTNLFPSLHTSYKINEGFSVQAGYSRRIFRPRLWDLNPFFNIRNNFSIRTGNPNLLPEFTDSYEVTGIFIVGPATMNFGVYHRYTTDVVERISTFENNVNTFMPFNIGTNRTTGIEFNAKYAPSRKLSFLYDFNYGYFNRQGSFEDTDFDFNADQWSSRLTTKVKLPADFDVEVTGRYRSDRITVQTTISENIWMDFGVRKKIMKGKGVINLSIRDVFASRIRESVADQPDFFAYNFGQRGRFVALGFSFGFGKGEAMEFSGQRRRF
ncbi:MAG: outer membrane beta-barrel family protein [Bacteroidota bacterium]